MNKPLGFKELKVIKIGNSAGVILPKELLAQLDVGLGDAISYTARTDSITLRASNKEFDEQMKVARKVMKERYSALRELAK